MIIQTTKEINGVVYDYTCSDSGMKILRDGVEYDEAIDPAEFGRQYTETDEPIEWEGGEGDVATDDTGDTTAG